VKLESFPKGVQLAVHAAQEKKAGAITVIDLSGLGAFTEYFVICTGFSSPQVQAICTEVEEHLYKHAQRSPEHREGQRSAEWALLDFGGAAPEIPSISRAKQFPDVLKRNASEAGHAWQDSPVRASSHYRRLRQTH
jgi:ribosome silencing factor RsfS/YbeB/iojap